MLCGAFVRGKFDTDSCHDGAQKAGIVRNKRESVPTSQSKFCLGHSFGICFSAFAKQPKLHTSVRHTILVKLDLLNRPNKLVPSLASVGLAACQTFRLQAIPCSDYSLVLHTCSASLVQTGPAGGLHPSVIIFGAHLTPSLPY